MKVYIIHRHAGRDYAPGCMEVAAITQAGQTVYSKAYPHKHLEQFSVDEVLLWCGLNYHKIDQSLAPKRKKF